MFLYWLSKWPPLILPRSLAVLAQCQSTSGFNFYCYGQSPALTAFPTAQITAAGNGITTM